MKLNTTTLIMGVALAVVAGLFTSTIFGIGGNNHATQSGLAATELITGHVTSIVTDSDGNIKEYRQSDNIVVQNGENCAVAKLFGVYTGTCPTAAAVFDVIALGNGTTIAVSRNSTNMASDQPAESGTPIEHNAIGLTRALATVTPTPASSSVFASTLISNTFTNNSPNSQTVTQSGLFNSTTIDATGLFARQHFPPISLNNGDSLTVQWTINIGGQTSLSSPGPT